MTTRTRWIVGVVALVVLAFLTLYVLNTPAPETEIITGT